MSFLNQLKAQAQTVQLQQQDARQEQASRLDSVERAAQTTWRYLNELAVQLNVLKPDGPRLSLDGKTPWPAMQGADFQVDARRKTLDRQEVIDFISMGWRLMPKMGVAVQGSVNASFLPEMERIEACLHAASVSFERIEKRVPPRNALQSVRYDYQTEARAGLRIVANHAEGLLEFRMVCVTALDVLTKRIEAAQIQTALLDELAKLLVGRPSSFLSANT